MKIKEIHIENFRSIKNETIVMDQNCLILLGKNEAGKSNVLKAIAALFGQYALTTKDQRKKVNNEKITNRSIYAIFDYTEEDVLKIEETFLKKHSTIKSITFKGYKKLTDFIKAELPYIRYGLTVVNNATPAFFHAEERQSNVIPEKDVYQNGNVVSFQLQGSKIDLSSLIISVIQELYMGNPYKCMFWHYENSFCCPTKCQ